jgi:hypothetical protein
MMIFGFLYVLAWEHRIFKNLVCIPHNKGVIMGGRHKFFKDPMLSGQDIRKTKYQDLKILRFFLNAL